MKCELSARITPGDTKCVEYRRSYSVTCQDCDHRAEANETERKMSKRGNCTKCKRADISLVAYGKCWKCYHEDKKSEESIIPQTKQEEAQMEEQIKAAEVKAPSAPAVVTRDELTYLRGLMEERLKSWERVLGQAETPRLRAELFIDMCKMTEEFK